MSSGCLPVTRQRRVGVSGSYRQSREKCGSRENQSLHQLQWSRKNCAIFSSGRRHKKFIYVECYNQVWALGIEDVLIMVTLKQVEAGCKGVTDVVEPEPSTFFETEKGSLESCYM